MNTIYLSLGSNLGNKTLQLQQAVTALSDFGTVSEQSAYYRSEAFGFNSEHYFVNQCILWHTCFNADEALSCINKIENLLGRIREDAIGYADRKIDIDILYFNSEIIEKQDLQVPHIQLHKRKFVLMPLAEIAADWIDPRFNKTISDLLNECRDQSEVRKFFP